MNIKLFLFWITGCFVYACTIYQKSLMFEQDVFYEVLPQIIDSIYQEPNAMFPIISEDYKLEILDSEKKSRSFKFSIGLADSVYGMNDSFSRHRILSSFTQKSFIFDTMHIGRSYAFDARRLKSKKNFEFVRVNDLPKPEKRWKKSGFFYLIGITDFSRIRFNDQKKFAILESTTVLSTGCSYMLLISIIKQERNWLIDKIETIMWE